jgi:competence protein ComGC
VLVLLVVSLLLLAWVPEATSKERAFPLSEHLLLIKCWCC